MQSCQVLIDSRVLEAKEAVVAISTEASQVGPHCRRGRPHAATPAALSTRMGSNRLSLIQTRAC
jgi:hypothetical protein